jgi:hypothetical protein
VNARRTFRRFAAFAFVIALFSLTANSSFAQALDPSTDNPEGIIVIGG